MKNFLEKRHSSSPTIEFELAFTSFVEFIRNNNSEGPFLRELFLPLKLIVQATDLGAYDVQENPGPLFYPHGAHRPTQNCSYKKLTSDHKNGTPS
jgi:hypothetical protein